MTDTGPRGDLRPPSLNADEKTTLTVFLDYLRDAVAVMPGLAGGSAGSRARRPRCNEVIAACPDLDRPGVRSLRETPPPSMRWLLVHMIEETARHAGHADILRERIDGAVGR